MLPMLALTPGRLSVKRFVNPFTKPRIGYLGGAGVMHLETVFVEALQKLGYKEGENIEIIRRLARPNATDSQEMAAELANMDLLLIVAASLPFALEIRYINPAMPMVLVTCPGMVSNGFAKTLQHPGGIYTGLDELPAGVTARRLQLLQEVVPQLRHIALLSATPGKGGHEIQLLEAQQEAKKYSLDVKSYRVTNLPALEKALQEIVADGMQAMLVFQGALTLANRQLLVDFATQQRLPVIYQQAVFAEIGGLMSWAPDLPKQFADAAVYVDKIIRGAKPGDLPVRHPEPYYLTLNIKAAGRLNIRFPAALLGQAHRIIE